MTYDPPDMFTNGPSPVDTYDKKNGIATGPSFQIFPDTPILERKVVEIEKVGQFFRESMKYETRHDQIHNELVHKISAYVLKEHLAEEYFTGAGVWAWPATTWQMFKDTHKDSWWMRRFVSRYPVKMKNEWKLIAVELSHNYIYPEADVPFNKRLGPPIIYQKVTEVANDND